MRRLLFIVAAVIAVAAPSFADVLPASGPITSGVGWRIDPFGSGKMVYHKELDIAVPFGTPIHPTGAGTVVFAGVHGGHGKTIIVRHAPGEETLYGHNSELVVKIGDLVSPESVIALSGNSGRSTGPHVHYEVRGNPSAPAVMLAKTAQQHLERRDVSARLEQERMLDGISQGLLAKIRGDTGTLSN
jgi:murein DD-endopeptidase MepM/ murein hydrolase activator NlpD